MNFTTLAYEFLATIAILISFVAFIFTTNAAFPEFKGLLFRLKLVTIYKLLKGNPIRAAFSVISFLVFFSILTSHFVPVEITPEFVVRYAFSRLPLVIVSATILLSVFHIEYGDWEEPPKDKVEDIERKNV